VFAGVLKSDPKIWPAAFSYQLLWRIVAPENKQDDAPSS